LIIKINQVLFKKRVAKRNQTLYV